MTIPLSVTADASPNAEPVALQYLAPESCSPRDSFLARIAPRTAVFRFVPPGDAHRQLSVQLRERTQGGFEGSVMLREGERPSEPRTVDGATCDEVQDALAVIALVALDPRSPLLPVAAPQPEQSPQSVPDSETSRPRGVGANTRRFLAWGGGVRSGLGAQLAPELVVRAHVSSASLLSGGLSFHAARGPRLSGEHGWGRLALLALAPELCVASTSTVMACVFVEGGVQMAEGAGEGGSQREATWFGTSGVSVPLRLAFARSWGLSLAPRGGVLFSRPTVALERPNETLFRVPTAFAGLELTLQWNQP